MQVLCPASKCNPYTSTLALHCHQAAARAEAEKQRLADAAAQREAEAAQLKREQEAAAAAKAQHAAAVKSFFDEQVGLHKRLTDSLFFGLAACFWRTAVTCTPFTRQTDCPASLALLRWQMQQVLLQVLEVREIRQRERENQQRDNALLRHRLAEEAQREAEAKVPHLVGNACCCNDALPQQGHDCVPTYLGTCVKPASKWTGCCGASQPARA